MNHVEKLQYKKRKLEMEIDKIEAEIEEARTLAEMTKEQVEGIKNSWFVDTANLFLIRTGDEYFEESGKIEATIYFMEIDRAYTEVRPRTQECMVGKIAKLRRVDDATADETIERLVDAADIMKKAIDEAVEKATEDIGNAVKDIFSQFEEAD